MYCRQPARQSPRCYRLIAAVRRSVADDSSTDAKPKERKLAAILYADAAGYSRLTREDEDATHDQLKASLDLISTAIELHDGRVVHYAGDAVLAEFRTVSNAVSCACAVQEQLKARSETLPEARRLLFRIGVNIGEVIQDEGEIYGDGVNLAARLEALSEPGGICISESVRTAIGKLLPLSYEFLGEQRVKNIASPVRAYAVRAEQTAADAAPPARLEGKPKIAILPFDNMSGTPDDEYFADGITEDIITALSKNRSLSGCPQFDLRIQGPVGRCASHRGGPRRRIRCRGQRAQGRQPGSHHGTIARRCRRSLMG